MDEEIERMVIGVRVDTADMIVECDKTRVVLDDLGRSGSGVGRLLEDGLVRAVRTGRLGFDDLKRVALAALSEIAAASIRAGIGSLTGGGPARGAGLFDLGKTVIAGTLGLPGRATGGPVAGGRAYLVGERGPEMFVPTAAGRIETLSPDRTARDVRVAIRIDAGGGSEPQALARSGRQVARAVRRALDAAER